MNNLKSKKWWEASLVRMIKTVAQTGVATIGTSVVFSEVNWIMVVSSSLLAGLLSLLNSLAGLPEVKESTDEEE